jgi:hypothetical protein
MELDHQIKTLADAIEKIDCTLQKVLSALESSASSRGARYAQGHVGESSETYHRQSEDGEAREMRRPAPWRGGGGGGAPRRPSAGGGRPPSRFGSSRPRWGDREGGGSGGGDSSRFRRPQGDRSQGERSYRKES